MTKEQSLARRVARSFAPSNSIRVFSEVENLFEVKQAGAEASLIGAINKLAEIIGKDRAFDFVVEAAEKHLLD